MTLLMALLAGWLGVSVLAAFGLGPVLHGAAVLAERHEAVRHRIDQPAA